MIYELLEDVMSTGQTTAVEFGKGVIPNFQKVEEFFKGANMHQVSGQLVCCRTGIIWCEAGVCKATARMMGPYSYIGRRLLGSTRTFTL